MFKKINKKEVAKPKKEVPETTDEVVEEIEEAIEEDKKEVSEDSKEKKEEKHRIVVLKELPKQEVRETIAENGDILHLITVEEALTQVMNQ